jgi:hypothetical protein
MKLFYVIIGILLVGCSATQPEQAIQPPIVQTQSNNPTVKPSITDTQNPTDTPVPTATSTTSKTPTPRPTRTSTPQPEWVTDFAQPILDVIALRPPDFQDNFDDKSGGWQAHSCGQRIKIQDGELVLTDCQAYRPNMNYADFVVEFDARFLPDTNKRSSSQFIFRLYDTPFTHIAVDYYGSVFIIDLLNREHLEFPSVANPGLETNHLLIIAKGSKFAFYVNNKPFYYLESPSVFQQGDILLGNTDGSGANDLANPAIVAFDNFKIWNIWDIPIP